nr:hypothetical protein [uncultured Cetobacterium sp.]
MFSEKVGFDYILENLDIVSKLGKKYLKLIEFSKNKVLLEKEYDNQEYVGDLIARKPRLYVELKKKLGAIRDISIIVERLRSGYVLDDVELFEVKIFSMISQEIYNILYEESKELAPQNLEKVIDMLDPDKLRIASFHIYSSYSKELSEVRKKIKETKNEELYEIETQLEDDVRKVISRKLGNYSLVLKSSIKRLGYLDYILAKVKQIEELGLVRPKLDKITEIYGMFNPKVKNILKYQNKIYQEVDVKLHEGVTIITGANMSGKTLTLKTIGLVQSMAQKGFFVPAKNAKIKIMDDIYMSVGDSQSIDDGLSSFAAEMLEIDRIIKKVKIGLKPLVLIDELARTTNPQEGRALLKSVISILKRYKIESLITTHYDRVGDDVRRLRVVGIKKELLKECTTYQNIEDYIDYSLIEVNDDTVPEEALTIAKLLKIDEEIVEKAYKYL